MKNTAISVLVPSDLSLPLSHIESGPIVVLAKRGIKEVIRVSGTNTPGWIPWDTLEAQHVIPGKPQLRRNAFNSGFNRRSARSLSCNSLSFVPLKHAKIVRRNSMKVAASGGAQDSLLASTYSAPRGLQQP